MQNRCCTIGCFLNNSSKKKGALVSNFNGSAQLYFTADIYCLYGKLTAVWNFTSFNVTKVKFASKWVSLSRSHVTADNEITLHWSEISKRFEFTFVSHVNVLDEYIGRFSYLHWSTFTWDPKWTQTGLKSQTALKSCSVNMTISLRQGANDSF